MLKPSALLVIALVAAVHAQPPFFSYSGGGGGPPPSSPFSSALPGRPGGPPSSSPFSSFSSAPLARPGGGPSSSSPYSGGTPGRPGGPPSSFGGRGPPSGYPSSGYPKPPRQSPPAKLFSWLGNAMSKFPGLSGPKLHFHSSKSPKPGSLSPSSQSVPPSYYSSSSGGPPRESLVLPQIPNSIYDSSSSSPFGGSSVTYAPSNSIDHPPVFYRSPSGGPPQFGPSSDGPSSLFGSRPPPSFSSRPPSLFSGGRPSVLSSAIASSPYVSSISPFGPVAASSQYAPRPPGIRNNLEVYPSQQVAYQTQSLTQNDPGYAEALSGGLQNLYGAQMGNKQQFSGSSFNQQHTTYNQPQLTQSASNNNYGATFHNIEPVSVAPMYDVGQHFRPSSADMNGSGSQQKPNSMFDTPVTTLMNDYAAQADAATAGSQQMMGASDLLSAATAHRAIPGVQILGQGMNSDGNPVFEVVADANSPTYDGHPVDLNKLISMIEPGAQIDTMPSYNGEPEMASSEQQGVYAEPANLDLESDAAISGLLSGNHKNQLFTGGTVTPERLKHILNLIEKYNKNRNNDRLHAMASESRPTVVKLDGTRLSDEDIIKKHFDKEIVLDDFQENENKDSSKGFIIVGMGPDNETGDDDNHDDDTIEGTNTYINSKNSNSDNKSKATTATRTDENNDYKTDDDLLAIVNQLRNSAANSSATLTDEKQKVVTVVSTSENVTTSASPPSPEEGEGQHPNHNYDPNPASFLFANKGHSDSVEHDDTPVINPIFDTVRPSSGRKIKIDSSLNDQIEINNSSSSVLPGQDIENSASNNQDLIFSSDERDDDYGGDDMVVDTDGDLAASASRNVKSVAIIVTPPPYYVKIKNKYKKVITPLSALTSTTPLSVEEGSDATSKSGSDTDNNTSAVVDDIDEAFSESLTVHKYLNRSSSGAAADDSSIIMVATTTASSLEDTSRNSNNNNEYNDSIFKSVTSTIISSGVDNINTNNDSNTNNGTTKKPRRYPVYRGKSTSSK